MKMKKRFNLRKALKLNITIRAKILCIISWIFKVRIPVPLFELRAKQKLQERKEFCMGTGKAFSIGFQRGLERALRHKV